MEINTSDLSSTISTTAIKSTKTSTTATTENSNAGTLQGTNIDTVRFSAAAIALTTSTDNESTKVAPETNIDPQQQIDQLQSSIDQDPNQAIYAQAGKVTDTAVKSLLG
jgi:hypothetical protein